MSTNPEALTDPRRRRKAIRGDSVSDALASLLSNSPIALSPSAFVELQLGRGGPRSRAETIEVTEKADSVVYRIDAPGCSRDDITVELVEKGVAHPGEPADEFDHLHVTFQRPNPHREGEEGVEIHNKRDYGERMGCIVLPPDHKGTEGIDVSVARGEVVVRVARDVTSVKSTRIEVKSDE